MTGAVIPNSGVDPDGNRVYLCPYCGHAAKLVGGEDVYPHRPELAKLRFWKCAPCSAWVGCHHGSDMPFGRLANAELRKLKRQAHAAFDPLWKKGHISRNTAYAQLARYMEKHPAWCHIGFFNEDECRRVIQWAEKKLASYQGNK